MPGVTPHVELHPQRQKIIDALIKGESPRKIATWCAPKLHHATLYRYKRDNITGLLAQVPAAVKYLSDQRLAEVAPEIADSVRQSKSAASAILKASPLVARAERIGQYLDDALLDEMAKAKDRDPRAVAALASASFKGIESAARLELHPGFVQSAPVGTGVAIHLHIGQESTSESPGATTITVEAEEIDMSDARKLR